MASETRQNLTLVTGGTGKTGRRIAGRLTARGEAIRIGSRRGEPAFDWEDPSGWPAALEGVNSVYVAYQPDLAVPGAIETVTAFLASARRAGVSHIVLLSGRGEPEAVEAEAALIASGLAWTIIRASWFFQNFSEHMFSEELRRGELVIPQGLAPEPFIDAEDIADIAVAALLDPRHRGQLYEVTGGESLSFAEAASLVAQAVGRPIVVHEVPLDAYRTDLREAGLPPEIVALVAYLFSTVLDGRNALPTNGVRRALGREPTSFASFARRTGCVGSVGRCPRSGIGIGRTPP